MQSSRKQRYKLDADDMIRPQFFTNENTYNFIEGLNASNAGIPLNIGIGGTNSTTFDDGKILYYDAASKRILSSNYDVTLLATAGIVPKIPWSTGVLAADTSANTSTPLSGFETSVLHASFAAIPDHEWLWFKVQFSFVIQANTGGNIMLSTRIAPDGSAPAGLVKMHPSFAGSGNGFWCAEGPVPAEHKLDDPLIIDIFATGSTDYPPGRSGIIHIDYKPVV